MDSFNSQLANESRWRGKGRRDIGGAGHARKGEITAPSQLFIRLLLVKRLMCMASMARRVDK
jgi:hypothetical protein